MGNPLILGETNCMIGVAAPMFSIQCTTFMELSVLELAFFFYKTTHVTMENFEFLGLGGDEHFWI